MQKKYYPESTQKHLTYPNQLKLQKTQSKPTKS